ncbi:tyrosine-type recombinase/integrase [Microbacterium oxydans]|nr:tyrosine-type recombinase/integrase [Microbacterium oxydans]
MRTMARIPELAAPALRPVSPHSIPTSRIVASALTELRARRSDIADVFEFLSLTGLRWGELRALRTNALSDVPLPQLIVERSHSDHYEEKEPKTWRGARLIPLSPRAVAIFRDHAHGKPPDAYLFTNRRGAQLSVGVVRKFPLGFRRHALRHYAASTWLRLGTPVNEVAEYLGDDPRTVLAVYAHVLGTTSGARTCDASRLPKSIPSSNVALSALPTIAFRGPAADTPPVTSRGASAPVCRYLRARRPQRP